MNLADALDQEVGQLRCEIEDLRQLPHETHERESMAEGEAETARNEASDLKKELEKTLRGCKAESPKVERLREEVKQLELQLLERSMEQDFVQAKVELEVHRAAVAERRKWEEEQRQLEEERRQRSVVSSPVVAPINNELLRPNEPRAVGNAVNTAGIRRGMDSPLSTMNVSTTDTVSSVHSSNITTPGTAGQVTNSVPQLQAHSFPCNIFESMAIPPLGKFSGENESEAGELFMDWIEQFELVASVCHWDDRAKLVNLTTIQG